MLVQVMYASAATVPFDAPALAELLKKARKHNESAGLSGILLYDSGSFLQILEGEESRVDSLYQKISADSRHTKIVLLLRREIEERMFGEWRMGYSNRRMKDIEGYSNFLHDPSSLQASDSQDRIVQLLNRFRDGNFRQTVSDQ